MNFLLRCLKMFLIGAAIGFVVGSVQKALADDVPPLDSPHWMHGKKAIMDVYTVDTSTLDVIATNEFAFETADDCANAMAKAMAIANEQVPKGALAIVKCFAVSVDRHGTIRPLNPDATEL